MYNTEIGSRIRACRRQQSITAAQLAEYAGISVEYMRAIESGKEKPSIDTFCKIMLSLDVIPSALLSASPRAVSKLPYDGLENLPHCDILLLTDIMKTFLFRKGGAHDESGTARPQNSEDPADKSDASEKTGQ